EQFRKVNRIPAEQSELAESHDWNHPEYVRHRAKIPENEGGAEHRKDKSNSKRGPTTYVMSSATECVNAEKSSQLHHDRSKTRPQIALKRSLPSCDSYPVETGLKDRSLQVNAKKTDAPQSDDPRGGQQKPDQRVPGPARILKNLGEVGAKPF